MSQTLTRLQVGHVIELYRSEYVVVMVNDCRARCVPTTLQSVKYKTCFDQTVQFTKTGNEENISPNAEVPIVRDLGGPVGIEQFFTEQKAIRKAGGIPGGQTPGQPAVEKKPSKCAFIDGLLIEQKHTFDEVLKRTLKAFPDADPWGTRSTIKARPYHIAKRGQVGKWIEVAAK